MYVCRLFVFFVLCTCVLDTCTTENILGHDCKVNINEDLVRSHSFDFNQLHRTLRDFRITTERGQLFRINVCGSLQKRCNNQDNVSVCLMQDGREKVIGRTNNSVVYNNGRLDFELHGDKCQDDRTSMVTIILKCNDAIHLDAGPELLPVDSNCTFYFIWYTRFACTPHKEIDCSTMDSKNRIYDLSRLSSHFTNYIAIMKLNQSSPQLRVELNVCHSVIFGHEVTCKFDSGVCVTEVGDSENRRARNFGDVSHGPYFENDILKLKYEGGDVCTEDAEDVNTSTIIEFFCDHSKYESHPTFLKLVQPCQYHFIWNTFAACPIELNMGVETIVPDEEGEECIAVNPITNFQYDLRSLKGIDYEVNVTDEQTLYLSVCNSLQNRSCGPNVASCLVESNSTKYWSAGKSKPFLHNTNGGSLPLLYYDGGAVCKDNTTWSTIIMFECGTEDNEGPKFHSIIDCKYYIHWFTQLVCERKIPCVAIKDNIEVDLTALVNTAENYKVTVDNTVYVLSVCQPIRPDNTTNCPPESAACAVDSSLKYSGGLPLQFRNLTYKSLGNPVDPPIIADDSFLTLTYLNGSPCPNHTDINLSSVIRFVCDVGAGTGHPTFKHISDSCVYHFEWHTSYACLNLYTELEKSSSSCLIYTRLQMMNLTSLSKAGGHRAWSATSNKNYSINLCGANETCEGAAVCEKVDDAWVSYGQIDKVEYDFSDNYTKMYYSNGATCDSWGKTSYSAEVWLQCVEDAGIGEPTVLRESDSCYVLFEWKTEIACGVIDLSAEHNDIDRNQKTKYSFHFGVQLAIIMVLGASCGVFMLWHFKVLTCPKCPGLRNRLAGFVRGDFTQVTYSRQRQEEDDAWGT